MGLTAAGHLWTVWALARRALFPTEPPISRGWSTTLNDPRVGVIRLGGRLSRPAEARDVVVLLHGLGGSSESGYMLSAARAARALDLASLRLNFRGPDGENGDFYHGGLTADLRAAVSSLGNSGFERIFVLGFSLGGHIALRFATEVRESRVRALAALCSPLDLAAGADAIDRSVMAPYRAYVLRRLRASYKKAARFGKVPTPPDALRRVRTLRRWDSLTVVPRYGFDDADDYYSKASAGPVLDRLRRPTLLLAAVDDPMIPPAAIGPSLAQTRARSGGEGIDRFLTLRWLPRGGHLGFPPRLDLGLAGPAGVEAQVLLWLLQAGSSPAADSRAAPSRTNGAHRGCD